MPYGSSYDPTQPYDGIERGLLGYFITVARLTLLSQSQLPQDAGAATSFDVTGNATPDSTPVGSINRARWQGAVASRKARMRADSKL